ARIAQRPRRLVQDRVHHGVIVVAPERRLPDVPADVERLIDKMLSKDPNERYQTSAELGRALSALRGQLDAGTALTDSRGDKPVPSIAVLPFMNMSPDPENQYFGDGLAEELINALAQIEGLRVAARTSAFRFRGDGVDIGEVGEKLNVETLLEGKTSNLTQDLEIHQHLGSLKHVINIMMWIREKPTRPCSRGGITCTA
ncbi:MAG: hypothetical protein P8181_16535, partial [bacterium]